MLPNGNEGKAETDINEQYAIPPSFDEPWFNSDVSLRCSKSEKLLYVNRKTLAAFSPVFNAMFCGDFTEKNNEIVDLECSYDAMLEILRVLHHIDRNFASTEPVLYSAEEYCNMYREADKYDIPLIRDMINQQLPYLPASDALEVALKLDLEKRDALARMSTTDVVTLLNQENDIVFSIDDVRELVRKFNTNVSNPQYQEQANIEAKNWSIPSKFDIPWPTSDAVIKTSDQQLLHVNKSVLASFSAYFHVMLIEKNNKQLNDVFEIDIEHNVFAEILQILHHVDRNFGRNGQKLYEAAMLTKLYTAAVAFDLSVIIELFKQQLPLLKPSEAFEVAVSLNLSEEKAAMLKKMSISEVDSFLKKTATQKQLVFSSEDMNEVLEKLRSDVRKCMRCQDGCHHDWIRPGIIPSSFGRPEPARFGGSQPVPVSGPVPVRLDGPALDPRIKYTFLSMSRPRPQ